MIRKVTFVAALVVAAAVAAPAFAGGGGGGGGSKSNYTVRVKNNGSVQELVSVTQGGSPSLAGNKTLNANQVGQFSVKKGGFVVSAWDPASTSAPLGQQAFTAGAAKRIYALAAINPGASPEATVVGSTGQTF